MTAFAAFHTAEALASPGMPENESCDGEMGQLAEDVEQGGNDGAADASTAVAAGRPTIPGFADASHDRDEEQATFGEFAARAIGGKADTRSAVRIDAPPTFHGMAVDIDGSRGCDDNVALGELIVNARDRIGLELEAREVGVIC